MNPLLGLARQPDQADGSDLAAMATITINRWLEQLSAWVLAEPTPVVLSGQRCDRLRPAFISQALQQALNRHSQGSSELVDWRWDSLTGRVSGVLLAANQLQRFQWLPAIDHFCLQSVATLQASC